MYEKTLSSKTVYQGLIIDVDVLEVELENGKRAKREIVRHGVAVAIIPRLSDGRFVFRSDLQTMGSGELSFGSDQTEIALYRVHCAGGGRTVRATGVHRQRRKPRVRRLPPLRPFGGRAGVAG